MNSKEMTAVKDKVGLVNGGSSEKYKILDILWR